MLLIPYHFDRLQGHNHYVRCYDKKKPIPYPLEYAKNQNTISTKEISGKWERGDSVSIFKGPLASSTLHGSSYTLPATPTRS